MCKISETHLAQLIATSSNHHYVRSVDIYPKCDSDILLAVGLANGRVALTTFGPSEYDVIGYPGKEFGKCFFTVYMFVYLSNSNRICFQKRIK